MDNVVALIGLGKGARFASVTYRTKETGELAKYSLILGASTATLYAKDIDALSALLPTLSEPLDIEAATAILASRRKSLEVGIGNNPAYTCADTYVFTDVNGVKVHAETGAVYVTGLLENKTVIEAGAPRKAVNSRPLTIAKRNIERTLPSARFRQFAISNVGRIAANGEVLEIETA